MNWKEREVLRKIDKKIPIMLPDETINADNVDFITEEERMKLEDRRPKHTTKAKT